MSAPRPESLVRPLVRKLHPYTPGEQPRIKGLIKLNTNENPYPPAPAVLHAIKKAADQRLRLYPNPTAHALREKLAGFHNCSPENIFVGNGSDEVLALAVRAFVEPEGTTKRSNTVVQFFTPSYSLYPVLAATHGSASNAVHLNSNFTIPEIGELRRGKQWDFSAALTLITTPNAPGGRGYSTESLNAICAAQRGVVLLDEAYVDFAQENALKLGLRYSHVLVARTFSKAYSLCFLRVGYCVGHPALIAALNKIRDSYNVNGLGQIAAVSTLENLPYYRKNFQRVIATRERLSTQFATLGFEVSPSQTNFLLVKPPKSTGSRQQNFTAEEWQEKLRHRKILVRWFQHREVREYLRISIGTDAETDTLIRAVKTILRHPC